MRVNGSLVAVQLPLSVDVSGDNSAVMVVQAGLWPSLALFTFDFAEGFSFSVDVLYGCDASTVVERRVAAAVSDDVACVSPGRGGSTSTP